MTKKMPKWKLKSRPPAEPLPLTDRVWRCQNCSMVVFWSFARDRYLHSKTKGQYCTPGEPEVAHPRIRD